MNVFKFNVSPKYKKSFIEFNYFEKNINNKKIKVIRELVWRFGDIVISVDNKKIKKFKNINELLNSIKKDGVLLFNDDFPFEYEFVSSWDGCSDDYFLSYEDGTDVEKNLEEELMNIINNDGIYNLEDNHGFILCDTIYEISGELNIKKLN